MDVRKIVLGVSGALLFLSGASYAQDGVELAATNPFQKQLLVEFEDGTVAIADDSTQHIYLSTANGYEFEVYFADAIAAAESSPAKRQQMLQQFRASLSDSSHMITIRRPRVATDARFWPRYDWCGDVICIDPYKAAQQPLAFATPDTSSSMSSCNHYLCPDLPWPCDMGPCGPNDWPGGLTFYSSTLAGWGSDEGGGTITQQDLVNYDKKRWENARQDACEEQGIATAGAVSVGATTWVACGLAKTGIGAVGCAAGIAGYGISLYQMKKRSDECFASYPGLGNW